MYRIEIENKDLKQLRATSFGQHDLKERFDIREWVEKRPDVLGEDLLIICKEHSSQGRSDLVAIDKKACIAIIELKRDKSGEDVYWQAITYAADYDKYNPEDIFRIYAEYKCCDEDKAQEEIEEFIDTEVEYLNRNQRIILVSNEFHPRALFAVDWLLEFDIDISCVRLKPYFDEKNKELYVYPETIIPFPAIKDYMKKKGTKPREAIRTKSRYSNEKGNYALNELRHRLLDTLNAKTARALTAKRLGAFLSIISGKDRKFTQEEVTKLLYEYGVGESLGQAGTHLSNISSFITNPKNLHLRQVIDFDSAGTPGAGKLNYWVIPEYRDLLRGILEEIHRV